MVEAFFRFASLASDRLVENLLRLSRLGKVPAAAGAGWCYPE